MCTSPVFYRCKHCGNFVVMLNDSGQKMVCCGEPMTLLSPNSTDGAQEKHVPVVTISGTIVSVKIGSVPHPMLPEHYIEWIFLETEKGIQNKCLKPGDAPEAVFALTADDRVKNVYEYCNLHGLWILQMK